MPRKERNCLDSLELDEEIANCSEEEGYRNVGMEGWRRKNGGWGEAGRKQDGKRQEREGRLPTDTFGEMKRKGLCTRSRFLLSHKRPEASVIKHLTGKSHWRERETVTLRT